MTPFRKFADSNRELPVARRRLLKLGGVGCLGLSLPRLFEARAVAAEEPGANRPARIKACIVVFYYGGPSHLDTYDMKPNAPAEVRGEFASIDTTVPGLRICEHLPHMAKAMHKVAVIRSMHHVMRLHDAACVETHTGRPPARGDGEFFAVPNERDMYPSVGSTYSALRRGPNLPVTHAGLPFPINNVIPVPFQTGGFLGAPYDPFTISGDPATIGYRADSLKVADGLTLDRIRDRDSLLRRVDAFAARSDTPAANALREQYDKAIELLASEAVRQAMEIGREDPKTRERFGMPTAADEPAGGMGVGAQNANGRQLRGQNLLLARRLVEAGVPFVNVYDFRQQGQNWDAHSQNFFQHKQVLLPAADKALAALIDDLDERGLLAETLVIALGEFGRTPRINKEAGRDHWPDCYSAIIAGGGVRGGQVYGASDKIGAYPDRDPVPPADLAATVFDRFGIDPATEIHDLVGRPIKASIGQPLHALFG